MHVLDFNGKVYRWPIRKKRHSIPSKLHLVAKSVIQEVCATCIILEEVQIPTSPKLYLDFYVPLFNIAIECQGEQHLRFLEYYHGNRQNYQKYRENDNLKLEWCQLNHITLVYFMYNESKDKWRKKLTNFIKT